MQITENTKSYTLQEIESKIKNFKDEHDISLEDIVSSAVRMIIQQEAPLSKLMQYCIDVASDQYISEEFYQQYPEILTFLALCGTDCEEVLFKAYIETNRDIFQCKVIECKGKIIGGCPKMFCENCNKPYFVNIEKITELFCSRCLPSKMGECTEKSRRRRHLINTVLH